jgi:putative tricarboxylic transport membrane protein
MDENRWSTRVAGLVLLILAVGYGLQAQRFEATAMGDPLGPRAFPVVLAVLTGAISLYLVARPDAEGEAWPSRGLWGRIGLVLLSFVAYAYLLVPLGFIVATILEVTALSLLFRGPPLWSVVGAVAFSFATYALFVYALGLPLPAGWLFT